MPALSRTFNEERGVELRVVSDQAEEGGLSGMAASWYALLGTGMMLLRLLLCPCGNCVPALTRLGMEERGV